MPGIITHNKVFFESINFLKREKQGSLFSKSIETLFNTDSFRKAGLFGAIGPNIFDYLPSFNQKYINRNNISYRLHTSNSNKFLISLLNTILSYKDHNNEWVSIQRAYLYGLISHYISDSIFHPFIYYWSGFATTNNKKDLRYFREQHLLFENNMDIYFYSSYIENNGSKKFTFNINDMFPSMNQTGMARIENAIKMLIFNATKEANPDYYYKLKWLKKDKNDKYNILVLSILIDLMPYLIKTSYKIKKSRNQKLLGLINYIKRKNILFADYLISYPPEGKVNTHILNLHKERWFHPTGAIGLHYESVNDLLISSCETISDIWKKIEILLHSEIKDTIEIENKFNINSQTGIEGKDYNSMQIQNPVRLRS